MLFILVETDVDVVVDFLLPVVRARRTGGPAFAVWRRPVLVLKLAEGVPPVIDGLLGVAIAAPLAAGS